MHTLLLPWLVVVGQDELPRWDTAIPTPGSSPSAGLQTPDTTTHTTVFKVKQPKKNSVSYIKLEDSAVALRTQHSLVVE